MTTAIMNSSFASNHMNQIAIEEIELAYPGSNSVGLLRQRCALFLVRNFHGTVLKPLHLQYYVHAKLAEFGQLPQLR